MTYFHRRHLVRASEALGLPGMYWSRDYVEDGGLMSYSADLVELRRRVATYVDKILSRTAKALGLVIPPSVLARADQVIE